MTFGRDVTFVDGVLQKVRLQLSLQHIIDMVDILQSWAPDSEDDQIDRKGKNEEDGFQSVEFNFKKSTKLLDSFTVTRTDPGANASCKKGNC